MAMASPSPPTGRDRSIPHGRLVRRGKRLPPPHPPARRAHPSRGVIPRGRWAEVDFPRVSDKASPSYKIWYSRNWNAPLNSRRNSERREGSPHISCFKLSESCKIARTCTWTYVSVSWYHYWKFFSNDDLPLNVCDLDLFAAPSSDEFYKWSVIQ